ncbi:unnamed protein product [Laminaria digitata]
MNPRTLIRTALVAASFVFVATNGAFANEAVSKFYGSYVGSGNAEVLDRKQQEVRDLDVTIESFKDEGFTIQWITVVRGANGARTGDDVKRREVTENFIPVEDKENVFVLAPKGGLFQKSELPNPLLGDAVRWAAIDGNDMTIYSLAISETGGSELQVYRRSLTEKGMDIRFMRLQDEDVKVRMSGKLVRTQ